MAIICVSCNCSESIWFCDVTILFHVWIISCDSFFCWYVFFSLSFVNVVNNTWLWKTKYIFYKTWIGAECLRSLSGRFKNALVCYEKHESTIDHVFYSAHNLLLQYVNLVMKWKLLFFLLVWGCEIFEFLHWINESVGFRKPLKTWKE